MKRTVIPLLITALLGAPLTFALTDANDILYQLDVYVQVSEYLDDVFREFSDGYVEADAALKRVNLLKHEYNKLVDPVPEEAEKLNQLVNKLLSRVENYFIYYKRANREDPEINIKMAQAKFELAQEAEKLQYMYL